MNYLEDNGAFLSCSGLRFFLKQDCPLGKVGDSIMSPIDNAILPYIYTHGSWQKEEIRFIADRINENQPHLILDIGANIGLFTRQLLHAFPFIERAICIEPAPTNFEALLFNLRGISNTKIEFYNFALGSTDSTMKFYQETANMGNYSLNADAMHGTPSKVIMVPVTSTRRWMSERISVSDNIIWKSDTQGYDELIITETPWRFWRRIRLAVVELWRIQKPEFDRDEFQRKISDFPFMSIGINNIVTPPDVMNYLNSNDRRYEDLYLWR
ncbi:MAG: FkbM family methyltransferase [Steroidobacteraceae bacterium]